MRGSRWVVIGFGVAVAAGAGVALYVSGRNSASSTGVAATQPTTAQAKASNPSTAPDRPTPPLTRYIDWLHRATPLTDAKLEESRLPQVDAAHLRISSPVYICPRGDLWLTHPDAPAIEDVLRQAPKSAEHVTRDRVVCALWDTTELGNRRVCAVVQRGEKFVLARPDNLVRVLESVRGDWRRARVVESAIIVPSQTGLAMLTVWPEPAEQILSLGQVGSEPVQLVPTSESLLAFIPQTDAAAAPSKVMRLAEGRWSNLSDSPDWKGPFIHLIGRGDGSVLQIRPGTEAGTVRLSAAPLDKSSVPRDQVKQAVEQLSADSPEARDAAERELIALGPGIWPVLEELLPSQPPEASFRIRDILASRSQPRLGNMRLVGDRLKVASRLADRVVFHADGGVHVARPDGQLVARPEAWIVVRDGGGVARLSDELSRVLSPGENSLWPLDDDWVIADPMHGCRVLLGKELLPLTAKGEEAYTCVVGRDRQGRLLLRRPDHDQYLLIDPWLADPTPRLPVWQLTIDGGQAGWDQDNWPTIKKNHAWALRGDNWKALEEPKERFANQPAGPAAAGDVLLSLPDGTVISGGKSEVVFRRPGFGDFSLSLSGDLAGSAPTPLAAAVGDGPVFLFNGVGRILRMTRKPGGSTSTWQIDGVFDKGMPKIVNPTRLWVDPGGRLCMAWDGNSLAIMFPSGRIPPGIVDLMPQEQVREARER